MNSSTVQLPAFPVLDGVEVRHCPGWLGYAVADNGTVWTAKQTGARGRFGTNWKELKPSRIQRGDYLTVHLSLPGSNRRVRVTVHKLVMLAFVGPRPANMQVRHKDGNPHNCRLDNLLYGTPVENGADAVMHGRHHRDNKGKLTSAMVREIKRRLASGDRQAHIAQDYGLGQMTVSDIKTGRTWAHVN